MPIFGHAFFGQLDKIFHGSSGDYIYLLVMTNPRYNGYFPILILLGLFLLESGRGRHAGTEGSGTSKPNQIFGFL